AAHGRPVQAADIGSGSGVPVDAASGPIAWFDVRGELVAIGTRDETGCGRVLRGFARGQSPRPPASEREAP
ncbi:MAG: hypothetical protein M3O50_05105, partial [Myxococcota bacterium]|nr:hypothetical protein [Myxococcota bacterium]